MSEETSTYWDIKVIREYTHRVCFDEPMTADEAFEFFVDGEYADITDEFPGEIKELVEMTALDS